MADGARGAGQRGRGNRRYVDASLLVLLASAEGHGYELTERMGSVFPLPDQLPDVSTVYRALAELEAQGAVRSEWAAGDGGGRKIYTITDEGRDLLQFWGERFRVEQQGLGRLLEEHAKVS